MSRLITGTRLCPLGASIICISNGRHRRSLQPCRHFSEAQSFNPIDELNHFSKVPLLPGNKYLYRPSALDVTQAQKYFRPPDDDFKAWKATTYVDKLPQTNVPEVAFLGRSNVGKSSLISELFFNRTHKIKISGKPGRTKAIHVYQIGDHFSLVDMPGYGENMPKYYASCVEPYLHSRKNLARAFMLIDASTGITEVDKLGLEMMEESPIPYAIILTKLDLRSTSEQLRTLYTLVQFMDQHLNGCFPQPFLLSSKTGTGMEFLRSFIAHATQCSDVTTQTFSKRPIT